MALRIMAVSAPENIRKLPGKNVLKSNDPVSLYNACRYAGSLAADGIGPWGESNWSGSRLDRWQSVLLMRSWEDDSNEYQKMLVEIQPNLLLIGAMSVCLPGALACATMARKILGDNVCIVLGGRHSTESIYLDRNGTVSHHASSPLLLMVSRRIDRLFDVVVSGEGECIIAWLGEAIDSLDRGRITLAKVMEHLGNTNNVPGRWIAGSVNNNQLHTIVSHGISLNRDELPSPCEVFGIHSAFETFNGRITAHVFSDMSCGCVFDCGFCSERRSVTGPIMQLNTSSDRLYRQIQAAVKTASEDMPGAKVSVFIEDSTMLAGSKHSLARFLQLMHDGAIDVRFGGQLTIDQVFDKIDMLRELKKVGLDYLFVGIETFNPQTIGGISKDVQRNEGEWIIRVEKTIKLLNDIGISCGSAILFGLGEKHLDRIRLLRKIEEWKKVYNAPNPISINWAVQHPLCGDDGGMNYSYLDWGIPTDEWLDVFQDFGEASVLYPIAGQMRPKIEEVREVATLYREIA